MKMTRLFLAAPLALLLAVVPAHAQAPRTWVSGVGDDANPCSRAAPCKTFAGAISKTASGGEIDVLDPGGFGGVTITKAITINGVGTQGAVLAASGGTGIVVAAPATDKVILRNLTITGTIGQGATGIRFQAGRELLVENVTIDGFTGACIDVAPTAAGTGSLQLSNSTLTKCDTGIRMVGVGNQVLTMENVGIHLMTTDGILLSSGPIFASIRNSSLNQNGRDGLRLASSAAQADVAGTLFEFNASTGINVLSATATARVADSFFFNNSTGLSSTGVSQSNGNNTFAGNTTEGNFTGAPVSVK